MRNALALAGQGAANQVHYSFFWVISFLPQVVTPLVAKAAGAGDTEAVQDRIRESFFLGSIFGLIGTGVLVILPNQALASVLPLGSAARSYATPYLIIRALTFLPSLLSTICFAAFRGSLDAITPLKISLLSQLVGVVLDPLLMFRFGMGISGAAAATSSADLVAFYLYAKFLTKKGMIKWKKVFTPPSLEALRPLLVGGLGVQVRAIFTHAAFIVATRATQTMDTTGTAAAAHTVCNQMWQLGSVFLGAMSAVASIVVPNELAKASRDGDKLQGLVAARTTANRLLVWGVLLGILLTAAQLSCLPLVNVFSPLTEVQQAARLPAVLCAAMQVINFPMYVGEGIQQGNQYFTQLAVTTAFASAGMLVCLRAYGHTLAGVWGSFIVFNFVRLLGVLWHHFYDGPLALRNIEKERIKLANVT
jgi:putative MATE family efflux protein